MAPYSTNLLLVEGVINHAPLSSVKNINAVFRNHNFHAWNMLTSEQRVQLTSGTQIKVVANSSFGSDDTVSDPDPTITYSVDDKPKTLTFEWAGSNASYQIGEQEAAVARDEASLIRGNSREDRDRRAAIVLGFVNNRRFEALRKFPEGFSNRFFGPKDAADAVRRNLSLFDFARMAPNGTPAGTADYLGYTRRLGAAWTTGMATSTVLGGLDMSLSANEFGRNFTLVYDKADFGGSKFFNHFDLMRTKMAFSPPAEIADLVDKRAIDFAVYVGTKLYIQLGEQERTAGKSYGLTRRADGTLLWMGIPILDEPRMDSNIFNPIVWVNWSYWKFHTRRDWWLREITDKDTANPTILKTAVLSEYQPVCENMRYGVGVMHTVVT